MNESKKDKAEWARLVYRNQADAIEAVKRRQWAVTNYVLLIFAAIIGYTRLLTDIGFMPSMILLLIALMVSVVGIYHLVDMHCVMVKYRLKAYNIADKYPFLYEIDLIASKVNFFKYFIEITCILILILLAGLSLVVLFIYVKGDLESPGISMSQCLVRLLLLDILFFVLFFYRGKMKTEKILEKQSKTDTAKSEE